MNSIPASAYVTKMEQLINDAICPPCGSIQHAGSTSPSQGRSIREFEEQMASLRKENFNLKLRIYFLEEKLPGRSSSNADGHENLMKKNIDLQVDIEVLRKELHEKQSLLCEAAKAMELMEEQQKATEEKHKQIFEELNQKINFLEIENKQLERSTNQSQMNKTAERIDVNWDTDTIQKIHELEGCVKQYSENTEELNVKINEMENMITQKDMKIKEFEEKFEALMCQNADLQEQLNIKEKEISNVERKYQEFKKMVEQDKEEKASELSSETKNLKSTIQKLKTDLENEQIHGCERQKMLMNQKELIDQMQNSQLVVEVYDYKMQLEDKVSILEEMERKLKEKTTAYEKACKVIKNFTQHSQNLQQEIDTLKKQNSLGNSTQIKEDSYGNHSTALCFTDSLETGGAIKDELEEIIQGKNYEINQLNMEIKKNRLNLQNLINMEIREKLCQIENLSKLLSISTSSVSSAPTCPIRNVDELQQSFTEFDLNVAIDRNTFLQKKINVQLQQLCSELELKKSNDLTTDQLNIKINEIEMSHRWSREACIILTARLEELAGFLDSLLKHKDVLGALGADRSREMRKAIDKSLDFSRSLNNMSLNITGVSITEQSLAQLSNISDLFDITVDKENLSFIENKVTDQQQVQLIENLQTEIKRLKKELSHRKVNAESLKKERRSLPAFFENQSESETWSEPDRSVSLARMGLEKSPRFNCPKENEVEQLSTSTGSETDRKGKSKSREKISKLEKLIAEKDDRLLEIQCQLLESDNHLKQAGLRARDAIEELEEYKKMNNILETELNNYRSKAYHLGENLEIENASLKRAVDEKTAGIEKIKEEQEKLKIEARIAEIKIEDLTRNIEELKAKHQESLEKVSEQEKLKFDQLHKELLAQLEQKLREQEEKHREYLARDWVSRVVYDEMKTDLEAMQKKYNEAQNTIEYLQENEVELNQRLIENEKAIRNLKKNLDDSTLQASKAILERTKLSREKVHFETTVQELIHKLEDIEKEKVNLELKVGQLEKSHSELIQRTLLSNNQGEFKHLNKPSSHGSDVSQSGYTSEDVPMPSTQKGGVQRAENSSPDLGIESDAGRASSVELAAAPRMLKSIENLGSRENVLEKETWKIQDKTNDRNERDATTNSGPIIHDCAKIEQENYELRRKLARTKRAFETTVEKLRTSNKMKEQVERDIRQQILKTHTVLRNVRSNMDSELDGNQD